MVKFGFIGLTDISEALCINLLKRTNTMAYVQSSSIARVEYVSNHGGVPCELATDVVDRADIIFIMHRNLLDVQATLYSILGNLTAQKLVLDLSVVSPADSLELAEMVKETGADYADLTVLKSLQDVESGQATILYGGSSPTFLKIQEYLKFMASTVLKVGGNSSAIMMKACYNVLYTQIQNGVNEMMLLASKAGLFADDIIATIAASSAQNAFIEENGKNISQGNYPVKTAIKKVHKQLTFAQDYSLSKSTPMKGLALTLGLYDSAMDRKIGNHDITEIYTVVERASH